MSIKIALAAASVCLFGLVGTASAVDVAGAEALIKAEKCTKCHDVTKNKKGPSFTAAATKFAGKAADLKTFLTANKDDHLIISKGDAKAVDNLVEYILSLKK
jgi:cytochrome c551/c552